MKKYNKLSKKELKEFAESYKNKHDFVDIMNVKNFNKIETNKEKRIDKRTLKFNDDWYGIYIETKEVIVLDLIPIAENYEWKRYCWQKGKNKL